MLTDEEKQELLAIAREAIVMALRDEPVVKRSICSGGLLQKCGAFVTLRASHVLRGCIGFIEATRPLNETVAEIAVLAALEDPRFPPVSIPEFDHCTIEISVLSPLRQVARLDEIEVGVHGLMIEFGNIRGLLLPQVATEYHWDREAFLNAVVHKAGLSSSVAHHPDAKIFVFTAEIVQEAAVFS